MSEAGAEEYGALDGLKVLIPFARDGRKSYVLSCGLAVLSACCQLGVLYVIYRTVRMVVADDDPTSGELYRLALWALVFVIGEQVFLAISTWVSHRAAYRTLERLRMRIGERLARVPMGFLTRSRSGEIQRTVADDVEKLELFLAHALPDVVGAVSVVALSTVWMAIVDWRLAIATASVVVVALPIMGAGMKKSMNKMDSYATAMARMNGSVVEMVRGLPVLRLFNRSDLSFSETRDAIKSAARFESQWGREFLPMFSLFFVLVAANVVFIMPVGLWLWQTDRVDTATLLLFFIVGMGYSMPILRLLEFFGNLNHLGFGAQAVLNLEAAGQLEEQGVVVDLGEPRIEVEETSFSHTGLDGELRQVLEDCSFVVESGTVAAFVGPSGSGKTTMAKLLCRFWDVDSGCIKVGGHDVREIPFDQLMGQIGFVFQETFLFDETVATNIRLGKQDASDKDVEAAARAARAHEFIDALPDGYETRLGELGARLSGGERQRLAIARAFLKNAPVLVLDEATAYADPENEAAIQDAISELMEGRTVLMIAHRLSTISGADQILVFDRPELESGRIVERGTHLELLEMDGLYAEMWRAFETSEIISLGAAVRGEATP